eukprot:718307-Pleurochrysis_carterae.AAC.1
MARVWMWLAWVGARRARRCGCGGRTGTRRTRRSRDSQPLLRGLLKVDLSGKGLSKICYVSVYRHRVWDSDDIRNPTLVQTH